MSKKRIATAALAACLFASAPTAQVDPDVRVPLRVEGRSLQEVVDFLAEQSGANIVVMEGGDELITLDLTDVLWRDALDIAAEYAGCVVDERLGGVLVVERPPRVTFVFQNADIREVIDAISAISGANIVVAPEVEGSLSLRVTDVPWRDVLEVSVKTLGYTVVKERRGMLRVVDPLSLQAQMETRAYQLRYARPRYLYAPIINSEFVNGAAQGATGNVEDDFPLIGALRRALTPGAGELDFIADQNVLIVRDTTQVHAEILEILERLDIEPARVFVDVKFVSTSNADLLNLGVDYGEGGPQISVSGSQIPITLPFNLGGGGFEDTIIANDSGDGPFAGPFLGEPLNGGGTIVPDTVFGALSFTQVAATLRLLQRDTRTEVVQAPKLLALDGRPATIFVGETIRYAEAQTEQGQAGGLSLSVVEAANSPVEVGFQLLVVPHVIPGSNQVVMEVIPKETSLSGTGDSELAPPGFDVFTIGASGLEGSIALPRKRSSTIVTSMLLDSGETAVIGGLTTDSQLETVSEVPYLSDIPLLGPFLFRHRENSNDRRSLMVFITPTIVRGSGEADALLEAEFERRRAEYGRSFEEILFGAEPTDASADTAEDGAEDGAGL